MFLRVHLTINHHWFRWWVFAEHATSHYLNLFWCSLLAYICVTRSQWVNVVNFAYRRFSTNLSELILQKQKTPLSASLCEPRCCHKNIERHTAHTIISWQNLKQWVIVHTSELMMIKRPSIYIISIITYHVGDYVEMGSCKVVKSDENFSMRTSALAAVSGFDRLVTSEVVVMRFLVVMWWRGKDTI